MRSDQQVSGTDDWNEEEWNEEVMDEASRLASRHWQFMR
jgi:hypothetical protein